MARARRDACFYSKEARLKPVSGDPRKCSSTETPSGGDVGAVSSNECSESEVWSRTQISIQMVVCSHTSAEPRKWPVRPHSYV